ncbi:Eukaryotic translation initiation factor 3 subunit I [Hondaea fermentalgiana]|uniref:Serine-threonine kinase receptor-associated protein n=1 Tax=Hondaea fermentalgiana TaxID=2315210 RepID=A0A2R5GP32_9STRA|nr:Eukaryotic translation initiation factor 3 subunit I [Hondaea fermentalgiana]|eukprot:GBG32640.1 Eukaryotic translation initiation factor 3 subunit I [Hondaea fermentalgiana]
MARKTPAEGAAAEGAEDTREAEGAGQPEAGGDAGIMETKFPIVCPGHLRPVVDVRFSTKAEDGVFLVSGCHDKSPMLRWADNGDWIGTFEGHKGAVWSAAFNSDATRVATGGGDFSARLWDAVNGDLIHQFDHKHVVKTVEFSPDDERLLTGGSEKKLRVFNLKAEGMPCEVEINAPAPIRKASWLLENGSGAATNKIILGCDDGAVQVWDTKKDASAGPEREWKAPGGRVKDLEVCASQGTITIAAGKQVSFYDLKSLELRKTVDLTIDVEGASLHPITGKHFVAGGSDLWVHFYDVETGKELTAFKGHHGPVFCLRYRPDGEVVASGSEDGTIRLWKYEADENKAAEE